MELQSKYIYPSAGFCKRGMNARMKNKLGQAINMHREGGRYLVGLRSGWTEKYQK